MEIGAPRLNEYATVERTSELIQQIDPDVLVRAVERINGSAFVGERTELTISFEPDLKRPVLRLVDRETQEVVRQVPAEHVLRLARYVARSKQLGR